MKKYNLSKIMKRAWVLVKTMYMSKSEALKKAWREAKNPPAAQTIAKYDSFNRRRYSNPWVAIVGKDGRIDFSRKVGGYTGAYGKGEAGELFISNPVEGAVYAYGQKDWRGDNGGYSYIQYNGGEFVPVDKRNLISALNDVA